MGLYPQDRHRTGVLTIKSAVTDGTGRYFGKEFQMVLLLKDERDGKDPGHSVEIYGDIEVSTPYPPPWL